MTPNQTTFIVGNAGDSAPQARDAISVAEAAALISSGSGVSQIIAGSNVTISPSGGTGAVTINATGGGGAVASVTASGAGITASPTTGAVVIANTGVTSIVAGTGITVSGGTGAVTINATGGGGGSPGGTSGTVQYNNAGAFGGVTGFDFASNFLTTNFFSSGTQVQFNVTGTPAQNVPFRVNAVTDVPVCFATYSFPDSFLAVAIGDPTPGPTQYTNDPGANGGMSAYFGLRTLTTGALYFGDNAPQRLAGTLVLGMDGTGAGGANINTISIGGNWTLPKTDGTSGQLLMTNGAGVASWQTGGGGGQDLSSVLTVGNDAGYLDILHVHHIYGTPDTSGAYIDLGAGSLGTGGADTFQFGTAGQAGIITATGDSFLYSKSVLNDARLVLDSYVGNTVIEFQHNGTRTYQIANLGGATNNWQLYNFNVSSKMIELSPTGGIGFYGVTPALQAGAIADSTDVSDTATKLNALLAAMRANGLIAT